MANVQTLIVANQDHWENAEYKPSFLAQARKTAQRLCAPKAKAVYQALEQETGVPWWAIAVIHEREASQSWKASLAQGDPWNRRSTHQPRGRGPFSSFHEAGIDALVHCPPYASRWHDWSPGGALTLLELYNGTGYERHGTPSPYIWSGAGNIYRRGKFYADGKYSSSMVDTQLGCAIMLKAMMELDPSIQFAEITARQSAFAEPTDTGRSFKAGDVEEIDPAGPADEPSPRVDPTPDEPDEPDATPYYAQGGVASVKSLLKSKISWLTNGLGLGGVGVVATSDNTFMSRAGGLLSTPQFWMIVAIVAVVGAILYCYWRDHGKGSIK